MKRPTKGGGGFWRVRQDKERQTDSSNSPSSQEIRVGSFENVASLSDTPKAPSFEHGRRAVWTGATLASALVVAFPEAIPARLNLSSSMPRGVYRLAADERPARGSLVAICLGAAASAVGYARGYLRAGACASGVEPVLKRVVAEAGDIVSVEHSAVIVNGARLPRSETSDRDAAGRRLEHTRWITRRLAEGELWVFSGAERSWDSRYFGPVRTEQVVGVAKPLLTVE